MESREQYRLFEVRLSSLTRVPVAGVGGVCRNPGAINTCLDIPAVAIRILSHDEALEVRDELLPRFTNSEGSCLPQYEILPGSRDHRSSVGVYGFRRLIFDHLVFGLRMHPARHECRA